MGDTCILACMLKIEVRNVGTLTGSCHCKLDIDFVGGVGDDSCMNADVINDADNPVTVEADASVPDGSVAVFDGTQHLAVSYTNHHLYSSLHGKIYTLKVIYHPLYGMNNYVLIWGYWLSCDPLRGSHDSQSPHIWGDWLSCDSLRGSHIRKHLCTILWQP